MFYMKGKRILELNVNHPIVGRLQSIYTTEETRAKNELKILYHCSLLAGGYPVENTNAFVNEVYDALLTPTTV
jgi:HSP90 family molecular chaperone